MQDVILRTGSVGRKSNGEYYPTSSVPRACGDEPEPIEPNVFGVVGVVGVVVNFAVAFAVSQVAVAPPLAVWQLVDNIRTPDHAPQAHDLELVIHEKP